MRLIVDIPPCFFFFFLSLSLSKCQDCGFVTMQVVRAWLQSLRQEPENPFWKRLVSKHCPLCRQWQHCLDKLQAKAASRGPCWQCPQLPAAPTLPSQPPESIRNQSVGMAAACLQLPELAAGCRNE